MAVSEKDLELDNKNLNMLPIKAFNRAVIPSLRTNVQIHTLALQSAYKIAWALFFGQENYLKILIVLNTQHLPEAALLQ